MLVSPPTGTSEDEYRGISEAFAAALHHAFIPGKVAAIVAAVGLAAAAVALVRWVRRERGRREAQRALEAQRRRDSIAASAERREYVRIPTRISLTVPRSSLPDGAHGVFATEDVSGGGLSYSSRVPPPVGTHLELVLDLDELGDVAVQAEVVRVQPSAAPRGPAIVGVAFREIASTTRDSLLRWIAAEEVREIAEQKRGPVCLVCGRPLGETHGGEKGVKMHPTCIPATTSRPPERVASAPPSAHPSK